jgi:hypothetical protein
MALPEAAVSGHRSDMFTPIVDQTNNDRDRTGTLPLARDLAPLFLARAGTALRIEVLEDQLRAFALERQAIARQLANLPDTIEPALAPVPSSRSRFSTWPASLVRPTGQTPLPARYFCTLESLMSEGDHRSAKPWREPFDLLRW